ncbi:MAG: glycosyltransferase family 39 protein [Cryomorphaceae bacterium]|nr:glycosyltransferase family 39 protein [Cryomorphaceae bacterium]
MLTAAIVLLFFSTWVFHLNEKAGIGLLLSGSMILRFWAAALSPFLYQWDEHFHAVVAMNLSNNMLYPMLMPDVKPYSDLLESWVNGHIWLHKQPFFLWLMAISIKIFGNHELAVRLPSVLLGTLSVYACYQIGKNLFHKNVGYVAGFLMATSFPLINLTTGLESTDHNDVAFISLITISFWFFSKYYTTSNRKWAILTGVVVGLAMLTKWLTGLMVFAPWGLILLIRRDIKGFKDIGLALMAATVVFLPWQIYAYLNFKDVYLRELSFNSLHFYEVVEGHGGDNFFHLDLIPYLYFQITATVLGILLLFSALKIWFKENRALEKLIIIFFPILFVYGFFTIAKTKMSMFPFMIGGLVFVGLGYLMHFQRFWQTSLPRWLSLIIFSLTMSIIGCSHFRYDELAERHELRKSKSWSYKVMLTHEKNDILKMREEILVPGKDYLIFNTRDGSHPHFYFYSGYPAYSFIPSKEHTLQNQKDGYTVVILNTHKVPEEILEIPGIIFYDFPFWE